MTANPKNRLHRRRFDGVHEEHHRRRSAAPGAVRRDHRADGRQSAAPRGIGDRRAQASFDAGRAGQGRDLHRPAQGARRRRLRRRGLPDRRLRAGHGDRLRGAEEIRPRATIADTLGVGGIMRALRTVPHLWKLCEDMLAVCPDAIMLQYVNPMAINTWAIAAKYPAISQVGLCHSVQGTAEELAKDLDIPYRAASAIAPPASTTWPSISISRRSMDDGSYRDLYPDLIQRLRAKGARPSPAGTRAARTRCATRC